jgi:hypothetical protein
VDEKLIARFWSKVNKSGPVPVHLPELGPCWVWLAGKQDCGYGKFSGPKRATVAAHRFSMALVEVIPPNTCVLHRCDNPACVNPAHLFLGSQADNMLDKVRKGRHRFGRNDYRGSRNPQSKLTESDVREIRRLHSIGAKQSLLATRYRVVASLISGIVARKLWQHVD